MNSIRKRAAKEATLGRYSSSRARGRSGGPGHLHRRAAASVAERQLVGTCLAITSPQHAGSVIVPAATPDCLQHTHM